MSKRIKFELTKDISIDIYDGDVLLHEWRPNSTSGEYLVQKDITMTTLGFLLLMKVKQLEAIREALDLIQYHIDAGNLNEDEQEVFVSADEALRKLEGKQ